MRGLLVGLAIASGLCGQTVVINGWGGTSTSASTIQASLTPQTNCGTSSSYVYSPFTGGCVLNGSGSMTWPGTIGLALYAGANTWGASVPFGAAAVTFSTTPVFALAAGDQTLTLTGNVSSSSVTGVLKGQLVRFQICQDAAGSRTFAWPAVVHGGGTIGAIAGLCSAQTFESFDGANLYAVGLMVVNQ